MEEMIASEVSLAGPNRRAYDVRKENGRARWTTWVQC
jgi:hypothetical protein